MQSKASIGPANPVVTARSEPDLQGVPMKAARTHGIVSALFVGALLLPSDANAQFGKGQRYLGAHIGVSGVGSTAAFGLNGEVAYNDRIAIGAWADTWSYGESFGSNFGSSEWNVRYVALAGTGAYHFPIESTPKLDPFLGVAVGYFIVSTEARTTGGVSYSGDASRIFVGGFGGARYFFSDALAGVARLGFGASYLTLGVDLKL